MKSKGVEMPGKSVQLSVRVSDDDALFLADLEVEGAVTPSEKLRAILDEAKRRHRGTKDPGEGGLMLRDMAAGALRNVRRREVKTSEKSELILNLYERIPDIMAKLISGPKGKGVTGKLADFENELIEQVGLILKDFIVLGMTSPARVCAEGRYREELSSVVELAQLARDVQNIKRGEK